MWGTLSPSKGRKYETHQNLFPASDSSFICRKLFSPKSKQTLCLRGPHFSQERYLYNSKSTLCRIYKFGWCANVQNIVRRLQTLLRVFFRCFCGIKIGFVRVFSDAPAEKEKGFLRAFSDAPDRKRVSCAVLEGAFWFIKIWICGIFSSIIFLSDARKIQTWQQSADYWVCGHFKDVQNVVPARNFPVESFFSI